MSPLLPRLPRVLKPRIPPRPSQQLCFRKLRTPLPRGSESSAAEGAESTAGDLQKAPDDMQRVKCTRTGYWPRVVAP